MAVLGASDEDEPASLERTLNLPFARRDLDRLRLILAAQNRLRELRSSPRVKQMLAGRGYVEDALRWMEVHGGVQGQELAAYWRSLDLGDVPPPASLAGPPAESPLEALVELPPRPRRRRRRRRRARPRPPAAAPVDDGR